MLGILVKTHKFINQAYVSGSALSKKKKTLSLLLNMLVIFFKV